MGKVKETLGDAHYGDIQYTPEPMLTDHLKWAIGLAVQITSDPDDLQECAAHLLTTLKKMKDDFRSMD
tara:strand:+ start:1558 stop:1761 length:204 start_codon:yes stop_codon:yes gene_type:complete